MSTNDFDLDQFKATYFEECAELLIDAETRLADLQHNPESVDAEDLNAIFRVVHSVKGGAGAFSFDQLVGFAHIYEALLDRMRQGEIQITEDIVTLLLSANDILTNLIQAAQNGTTLPEEDFIEVKNKLNLLAFDQPANTSSEPSESETVTSGEKRVQKYIISFIPKPELLQHANEPLLLVREMKELGQLTTTVNTDRLPSIQKIISDEAYFSWVFELVSDCSLSDVEEVFEFVTEDCDLEIKIHNETEAKTEKQEQASPELVSESPSDSGTKKSLEATKQQAVEAMQAPTIPTPPSGKPTPTGNNQAPQRVSSIRVELDRVDRLVNMVGELVITQAMLRQQVDNLPSELAAFMAKGFEDLGMHTREIQESVMAVRMQPVKSVFARIPRLVRELATKLGKKVELETSGEHTEVDKTVIEQLSDPLTHMIRNSLDHGIEETPADRVKAGKPELATVTLSAEHRSGRIHIIVTDDGRGINRERVKAKAIEKGIISPDENLSDEAIDDLIFSPGFSTAEEVTDVSGRGVGMDVVRRNISNLGGRISVQSTPGKGTKFIMSLPLTLAVLDGMVVAVGKEKFIISLTAIIESLRPTKTELHKLSNGAEVVALRGEYIRLVKLHRLFNIPDAQRDPSQALVVVVEIEGGKQVGILVDELLGQQQVVIKSLEENYDPVAGISAATILGNGMVALILDVDGLDAMARQASHKHEPPEQTGLLDTEKAPQKIDPPNQLKASLTDNKSALPADDHSEDETRKYEVME
ncbi:chemotaxis protein CheA [Kiloniella litopenaei]|uniref:Chemotaxis protein CheA n=1 Tax=Kiloniella litopenaei TaxID=1549748 RepID=A0A0M2R092_9PROT|nr:chemotaxis protein CheA [Kiloniella litopenaei]KKJ75302.1 chemotaxis protein CheA [Kiloniella litopenaei]